MAYRVRIENSSVEFEAEQGEPLLDAALRCGVELPFDCQCGGCGTCRVQVRRGDITYDLPPMALTAEEEAAGFALTCQACAASDLVIRLDDALAASPAEACGNHSLRLRELAPLCHDVMRLVLEVESGEALAYRAGQYLDVLLDGSERRSFSFASAPERGVIDLHVRRVPGGRFSQYLFEQAKPGDILQIEAPQGGFYLREESERPLLMVAGGTGLAPIKSLIERVIYSGVQRPVYLYWGVRSRRDLYLDIEALGWAAKLAQFRYVPVLSEPVGNDGWSGRVGFVHQAAAADLADLSGFDAYLCGPPAMISAAKGAFAANGLPIERIYADAFNFAHELTTAPTRQTA
ncbi:hypothetical protein CAI21_13975 [Alkalilimnicola ehrlichii]|uniref:CDP-6-deoxy-delta-3,4-glucoseen reductase n=1 Tax=Alkalilimnicola ehrlichii TaxID=351052 RepID=A0A3E0WR86_9GAMM|nr:2Fe-2S iron-sulfur cluster-binding protein [Alkalilimnicola ehrlichii]RFA28018.1 hypothetical protein CAI21_13975 [Alkalilimnicola ehrlichii]RFA34671.1 hypothetical protein CAL65_15020 [Alkalilimnicola ehrlichii]